MTTNDDQQQPPCESRYIDNLISRTFNIFNSASSNLRLIPYPAIPIIKPALTPDMLSNTFGQWEPNEQFKEQDSRMYNSNSNNYNRNDDANNTNSPKPPHPSSSSPLIPDSSMSHLRENMSESRQDFSSTNSDEEKSGSFKRQKHPSNESIHGSIDQKPANLLPADPRIVVSDASDQKDQEGRARSAARKHESSLNKAATLTSTVTIRIGRIEVKAVLPKGFQQSLSSSPPPQASQDSEQHHLTLKDYLKQRSEGRY